MLHLGPGKKYMPEAVNVDLVASTRPDMVHNLDRYPWPLADVRFAEVRAFDVVELDDVAGMRDASEAVCTTRLQHGTPLRFDHTNLREELSTLGRARELSAILQLVLAEVGR